MKAPKWEFREEGKHPLATPSWGDQSRLPGRGIPFMPKAAKAQRREWLMPPTLGVHLHGPGSGREQHSQERSGRSEGARATAWPGAEPSSRLGFVFPSGRPDVQLTS